MVSVRLAAKRFPGGGEGPSRSIPVPVAGEAATGASGKRSRRPEGAGGCQALTVNGISFRPRWFMFVVPSGKNMFCP